MPLAGQTIFIVGRIQGLTRRRLDQLVRARGGKLAARPGASVTTIVSPFGCPRDERRTLQLPPGLPKVPRSAGVCAGSSAARAAGVDHFTAWAGPTSSGSAPVARSGRLPRAVRRARAGRHAFGYRDCGARGRAYLEAGRALPTCSTPRSRCAAQPSASAAGRRSVRRLVRESRASSPAQRPADDAPRRTPRSTTTCWSRRSRPRTGDLAAAEPLHDGDARRSAISAAVRPATCPGAGPLTEARSHGRSRCTTSVRRGCAICPRRGGRQQADPPSPPTAVPPTARYADAHFGAAADGLDRCSEALATSGVSRAEPSSSRPARRRRRSRSAHAHPAGQGQTG